jgi:hypothetical protein
MHEPLLAPSLGLFSGSQAARCFDGSNPAEYNLLLAVPDHPPCFCGWPGRSED